MTPTEALNTNYVPEVQIKERERVGGEQVSAVPAPDEGEETGGCDHTLSRPLLISLRAATHLPAAGVNRRGERGHRRLYKLGCRCLNSEAPPAP